MGIMYINRASLGADHSIKTTWVSDGAPDPDMSQHPQALTPGDYTEFVVLGSYANSGGAIDPTGLTNQTGVGITCFGTLGVGGATVGQLVFCNGLGAWQIADASSVASMPATGIALATGIQTDVIPILRHGYYYDTGFGFGTVGVIVYASAATAGLITVSAPAGVGDQVQAVGIAETANLVFFMPSLVIVEVV
jgi:hypothetical protein